MNLAQALPFYHDPVFLILVGVVIVVGGIITLKLNPFLALLIAAFAVALLTPASSIIQFALNKGSSQAAAEALAAKTIGERIATEFGNTCTKIGILIAMAAIIGKSMLDSGAAERIVRSMLNTLGIQNAPVAFLVSSFFLGIPVFFDIVIFLMIPLAKAVTMRTGRDYLLLVLAITGGAAMANSFVPPAPGPLFLIGEMNIPIGMMMIGGTMLGLITITAGYFFAKSVNKKWPVELRDSLDAKLEDIKKLSDRPDSELPPHWMALLPVVFPLVMICTDNIVDNVLGAEGIAQLSGIKKILADFIGIFGDKNIALITGGIFALLVLLYQKKGSKDPSSFVQAALMSGGGIILIT